MQGQEEVLLGPAELVFLLDDMLRKLEFSLTAAPAKKAPFLKVTGNHSSNPAEAPGGAKLHPCSQPLLSFFPAGQEQQERRLLPPAAEELQRRRRLVHPTDAHPLLAHGKLPQPLPGERRHQLQLVLQHVEEQNTIDGKATEPDRSSERTSNSPRHRCHYTLT